jgi:hypothetical protein
MTRTAKEEGYIPGLPVQDIMDFDKVAGEASVRGTAGSAASYIFMGFLEGIFYLKGKWCMNRDSENSMGVWL